MITKTKTRLALLWLLSMGGMAWGYWQYFSLSNNVLSINSVAVSFSGGTSLATGSVAVGDYNTLTANSLGVGSGLVGTQLNCVTVAGGFRVVGAQNQDSFEVNGNTVSVKNGAPLILGRTYCGIPSFSPQ